MNNECDHAFALVEIVKETPGSWLVRLLNHNDQEIWVGKSIGEITEVPHNGYRLEMEKWAFNQSVDGS